VPPCITPSMQFSSASKHVWNRSTDLSRSPRLRCSQARCRPRQGLRVRRCSAPRRTGGRGHNHRKDRGPPGPVQPEAAPLQLGEGESGKGTGHLAFSAVSSTRLGARKLSGNRHRGPSRGQSWSPCGKRQAQGRSRHRVALGSVAPGGPKGAAAAVQEIIAFERADVEAALVRLAVEFGDVARVGPRLRSLHRAVGRSLRGAKREQGRLSAQGSGHRISASSLSDWALMDTGQHVRSARSDPRGEVVGKK
jgi:hypothetical protein